MSIQIEANQRVALTEKAQLIGGLEAFFKVTDEWGLSRDQCRLLLGFPGTTLYTEWKSGKVKDGPISTDLLDRLSYILSIYKALKIMHSEENRLLFMTNATQVTPFNCKSPLEYMLSGHLVALADVRRYLDFQRGM